VKPLIDTKEVARLFNVSPKTVLRMVQAGELECVVIGRHKRRIIPRFNEDYIHERMKPKKP